MEATIALAGNPNSGKTTLFNALTGARQHVGNYPGVTVEKKEGSCSHQGHTLHIVDLPGTYSLTAYSIEELVARNFLAEKKPEVVIDIVDASNLERNLYLAVQFLEMGTPLVLALNMIDAAQKRGIEVNADKLSEVLSVPVIPTIARTGKGKESLLETAIAKAQNRGSARPLAISYGNDLDKTLAEMEGKILAQGFLTDQYPARWIALKFLENDEQILEKGENANPAFAALLKDIVKKVSTHLERTLDTEPEALISDHRYGYIHGLLKQDIVRRQQDPNRLYTSDQIDRFLTHRLLGPLVMLTVLLGLYHFTFTYSKRPVGWVESVFGWIRGLVSAHLSEGLFKSLVLSGIIDGVGGVLGFVPLILFMFFGIAILEDSGYLARVAYMLDRVFRVFGLHGSSVMAFIISGGIAGGCAVPGVLATRTLRSPRERLATLLTVPFMNCGAKLPVFALLTAAFFAENEASVLFAITLISWAGALLTAKLLRSTIIKGPATPFVMELPPYRIPTFKGLLIHTWERTWQYVKKAGTVILAIAIVLWAMMTFPSLSPHQREMFDKQRASIVATGKPGLARELKTSDEASTLSLEAQSLKNQLESVDRAEAQAGLRNSLAGRIGTAMESITHLAGFDWRTNIALLGGFAAKEVLVSTLGTAYSLGEVDPEESKSLSEMLAKSPQWSPRVAWSLILFTIFYAPCFATVVCIAREAGSWKWGVFSIVFNTMVAFVLAVFVYQTGAFLGLS
jgi:ferrous iron transport protein B